MCVVSMVFDHFTGPFEPYVPMVPWAPPPPQPPLPFPAAVPALDPSWVALTRQQAQELGRLIAEFREALRAARVVDKLTGQPDCQDPDKAELLRRVQYLEQRLAELGIGPAPAPAPPP